MGNRIFGDSIPGRRSRVPRVYLTWANQMYLAFFASGRINNLTSELLTYPKKAFNTVVFREGGRT